jgi:hypothetical protein
MGNADRGTDRSRAAFAGDLPVTGNRLEPICGARSPGCNGAFGMMLGHIRLLHPLIKKRKHNQPFGIEPVLGA